MTSSSTSRPSDGGATAGAAWAYGPPADVLRRVSRAARWWTRVVRLGVIANLTLALPAIFIPNAVLGLARQRISTDPMWVSFASLLLVLLSLFYLPGARDPLRYRATAWLSVLARFAGVVYFLCFHREYYVFGLLDLFFGVIELPLLFLTLRAARRMGVDDEQD